MKNRVIATRSAGGWSVTTYYCLRPDSSRKLRRVGFWALLQQQQGGDAPQLTGKAGESAVFVDDVASIMLVSDTEGVLTARIEEVIPAFKIA